MSGFKDLRFKFNAKEAIPGAQWNEKCHVDEGFPFEIGIDDYELVNGLDLTVNIYARYNNEFKVEGAIDTSYRSNCARCLKECVEKLHVDFSEKYIMGMVADDGYDEQREAYIYKNSTLDFEALVLDNVALNMPIRVLCKEDCKGICPKCGADLNSMQCKCGDEDVTDESGSATVRPFEKLRDLYSDNNKEV